MEEKQYKTKIRSFTDLIVWKEAHNVVLMIYKAVKRFPKEETYSLEGFSRQSKKEKSQFYYTAKGSLTELQNQLLVARDVTYISQDDFRLIANKTVIVHKLINGLIKTAYTKYKIPNTKY